MTAVATPAPAPRKTGRNAEPAVTPPAPLRPERGTPEQAAASLRGDLAVAVYPGCWASFTGTAQQLIDEGLLPPDFKFPDAWQEVRLPNLRDLECVSLRRKRLPRTGASRELVDNWSFSALVPGRGSRNYRREEAARLLALDRYYASPQWKRDFDRYFKAQRDTAFQAAMNFKGLARAAKGAL